MNIDYKIRRATLETAVNVILIKKRKSIPRTARNIVDIGCSLSGNNINETIKTDIYNELIRMIPTENIKTIKNYIIKSFLQEVI